LATARRMARSTSTLAPFAIAHTAGQPATAPAFRGEKLSAILRARAAGGGERDRPAGTSEHTYRASDLLRRERERERASVVVGTGVAFCGERVSGVGRRRHIRTITTYVSDVRKKATLCDNQRRRVLRHETQPIWSAAKEMHPTSMRL
jgi:hypothetical protein